MKQCDLPPPGEKKPSQPFEMPLRLLIYEASVGMVGVATVFLPGMSYFTPLLFGRAGLLHLARGGWWLFFPTARRTPVSRLAAFEVGCLVLTGLAVLEAQWRFPKGGRFRGHWRLMAWRSLASGPK